MTSWIARVAVFSTVALMVWAMPLSGALAQQPEKGFAHKGGGPGGPGKRGEFHQARDGMVRPVHERMSPEDRRQLRRDIDQHGRDIYRGRK